MKVVLSQRATRRQDRAYHIRAAYAMPAALPHSQCNEVVSERLGVWRRRKPASHHSAHLCGLQQPSAVQFRCSEGNPAVSVMNTSNKPGGRKRKGGQQKGRRKKRRKRRDRSGNNNKGGRRKKKKKRGGHKDPEPEPGANGVITCQQLWGMISPYAHVRGPADETPPPPAPALHVDESSTASRSCRRSELSKGQQLPGVPPPPRPPSAFTASEPSSGPHVSSRKHADDSWLRRVPRLGPVR